MRVVERTEQRLLLIIAAELADRTLGEQFPVEYVPVFETGRTHSRRRADCVGRLFGIGNVEWAELAAQETCGGERFEFLTFAQVEALADVDERRHRRVLRSQSSRDDCPDMRRGHGLRRRITGVPLVLMAGVKNEPKVARGVTSNQC